MSGIDAQSLLRDLADMNWHAKFRATESLPELLQGLTQEQAQRRFSSDVFSIEEILQHLTHWKIYYRRYLLGLSVDDLGPRLPDDGSAPGNMAKWPQIIAEHDNAQREWLKAVESVTDEKLREVHPQNRSGLNVAHVIGLLALHDAYHIGQIYALRAML